MLLTPPAAPARVAVSNPSHSVRPGSFTCTCGSTPPGRTMASFTSRRREASGAAPCSCTPVITPPAIATAAGRTPSGVTTRVPRMTRSASLKDRNLRSDASEPRHGGGSALRCRRNTRRFPELCNLVILPVSRAYLPGPRPKKVHAPGVPAPLLGNAVGTRLAPEHRSPVSWSMKPVGKRSVRAGVIRVAVTATALIGKPTRRRPTSNT